jgi:hypothetical protein
MKFFYFQIETLFLKFVITVNSDKEMPTTANLSFWKRYRDRHQYLAVFFKVFGIFFHLETDLDRPN